MSDGRPLSSAIQGLRHLAALPCSASAGRDRAYSPLSYQHKNGHLGSQHSPGLRGVPLAPQCWRFTLDMKCSHGNPIFSQLWKILAVRRNRKVGGQLSTNGSTGRLVVTFQGYKWFGSTRRSFFFFLDKHRKMQADGRNEMWPNIIRVYKTNILSR